MDGTETRKVRTVLCLDTGERWIFSNKTALEAMDACIYTLNLKRRASEAKVLLAGGGRTLYCEHSGQTWATIND